MKNYLSLITVGIILSACGAEKKSNALDDSHVNPYRHILKTENKDQAPSFTGNWILDEFYCLNLETKEKSEISLEDQGIVYLFAFDPLYKKHGIDREESLKFEIYDDYIPRGRASRQSENHLMVESKFEIMKISSTSKGRKIEKMVRTYTRQREHELATPYSFVSLSNLQQRNGLSAKSSHLAAIYNTAKTLDVKFYIDFSQAKRRLVMSMDSPLTTTCAEGEKSVSVFVEFATPENL